MEKKINVPCGHCPACMQRSRQEWIFRIEQEQWYAKSAHFVTLTYDDVYFDLFDIKKRDELKKNDIIKYLKRLRKYEPELRYFAVGEYGTKNKRPHYHAILFNVRDSDNIHNKWSYKGYPIGRTHSVNSNSSTIAYVTKYLLSDDILYNYPTFEEAEKQKPFRLMSKGLGKGYLEAKKINYHLQRNEIITKLPGHSLILPRYLREKIFTKEQLKVLNDLARCKAMEEQEKLSYEEIQNKRLRLKYEFQKKSKSK